MPDKPTTGNYLGELHHVAVSRPDHIAVIDEERSISYAQLIGDAGTMARQLRQAGVTGGHRVAIVAENSASFLTAAFAVWEAGAVLVTVYPSTARDDLRYTLQDADPVLVLVDRVTADPVRAVVPSDLPVVLIDDTEFEPGPVRTGTAPDPQDLREPLFLICYSSGTTSRPKAIMLSQEAMYNGARTYADVWHLHAADRTLVCLPMAWLYGLDSTSMATLLVGGTVISRRRARPDVIVDAIEQHGVTFLPGVTTVFTKLVEFLEAAAADRDLSTLRLVVSGGEPRNEAAFGRFERLAGQPVFDTFCASELFPLITYDPVEVERPVLGSAGKLVPRSELKIVDAAGNEVQPGAVGEALSRGPGLMLGYWNNADETAKALTPDGWYRTKDLVRIDQAGFVHVMGRLSDMIIRGGSNVSPAEVERSLRGHSSIADVCVVGRPDPIYGEEVVAAVILADGLDHIDAASLRAHAAHELASFKIPTAYVALDRFPASPTTGKVDRRAVAGLVTKGMAIQ